MAVEFLSKDSVKVLWQKINALVDTKMAAAGVSSITTDDIYPVGSVYYTTFKDFDPNMVASFPGTWVRVAEGQFIVTAGTGTDSGGQSKTFTTGSNGGVYAQSLNESHLPIHSHSMEHTHTTTAQSAKTTPSGGAHGHTSKYQEDCSGSGSKNLAYSAGTKTQTSLIVSSGAHTHNIEHTHTISTCTDNTGSKGAGAPVHTVPPAFGLYAWQRTT